MHCDQHLGKRLRMVVNIHEFKLSKFNDKDELGLKFWNTTPKRPARVLFLFFFLFLLPALCPSWLALTWIAFSFPIQTMHYFWHKDGTLHLFFGFSTFSVYSQEGTNHCLLSQHSTQLYAHSITHLSPWDTFTGK